MQDGSGGGMPQMPQGPDGGPSFQGGPVQQGAAGGPKPWPSPPFQPPGMNPQPSQPLPPTPQPLGGWVDAGYGEGPLNANGMQWQGGGAPPAPPRPPFQPPGPSVLPGRPPDFQGGPARQGGMSPGKSGGGSPPFMPPTPQPQIGQQNQVKVHNPTGIGATTASQKAAAMRPTPAVQPKKSVGMMPPDMQKF